MTRIAEIIGAIIAGLIACALGAGFGLILIFNFG